MHKQAKSAGETNPAVLLPDPFALAVSMHVLIISSDIPRVTVLLSLSMKRSISSDLMLPFWSLLNKKIEYLFESETKQGNLKHKVIVTGCWSICRSVGQSVSQSVS